MKEEESRRHRGQFPVPRPNNDSRLQHAAIIRVASFVSLDLLDYAPADLMRREGSPSVGV
jgi:hypothetical protein